MAEVRKPVRPYPVLAADGRNDLFERIVSSAGALRSAPAGAEKSVIVTQSKDLGRQIATVAATGDRLKGQRRANPASDGLAGKRPLRTYHTELVSLRVGEHRP